MEIMNSSTSGLGDIHVNNLDEGYEQCVRLHKLTVVGSGVLFKMETVITGLKANWRGGDATSHINNLITVYDALHALISDAKSVSAYAADKIVAIQEVRHANGGGGMVGERLDNSEIQKASLSKNDVTAEYYVAPEAKANYEQLCSTVDEYNLFVKNFKDIKNELLSNWTVGARREEAVASFNEFEGNTESYNKYLTDARDNLGIAISNISQLQ